MTIKRSIGSVAAAFSAALIASTAANAMTGNASALPQGATSKHAQPSPAALIQIDKTTPHAMMGKRPTWGEVWPETTFTEIQQG